MTSCQEVFQFGGGSRDAAGDFVAADAGEDYAVSLGGHAGCDMTAGFGRTTAAGAGNRREMIAVEFKLERFSFANVDVGAGATALFFYFGEVGALVPVGLGVVVAGDGVEARSFGGSARDDGVRHAHDGGGVHAAAKLSQDGTVGAEPAADGFAEDGAEVLFVFGVGSVTDFVGGIEIPILGDGLLSITYEYRT